MLPSLSTFKPSITSRLKPEFLNSLKAYRNPDSAIYRAFLASLEATELIVEELNRGSMAAPRADKTAIVTSRLIRTEPLCPAFIFSPARA